MKRIIVLDDAKHMDRIIAWIKRRQAEIINFSASIEYRVIDDTHIEVEYHQEGEGIYIMGNMAKKYFFGQLEKKLQKELSKGIKVVKA